MYSADIVWSRFAGGQPDPIPLKVGVLSLEKFLSRHKISNYIVVTGLVSSTNYLQTPNELFRFQLFLFRSSVPSKVVNRSINYGYEFGVRSKHIDVLSV